ncbi:MAG: lipase/acyltransferase domain-containing protein, partial [Acidimicrobiales bacterium]
PTFKKFDFVTHSLGNFVLRSFMKEYEIDVINKVVFACPPFRGSLEIVKAALVGQGLFGWVKTKTRKIIRSMPGALELLPTYKGCARFSGSHGEVDFFDQSHWQSNVTSSRGGQDSARLAKKFKAALKVAWETVDTGLLDLADLPEKVRDRMLVIARHGSDTMQEVDVTKSRSASGVRNLVDLEHARLTEHGDGTVPHVSSCCYWDCIQTLVLTDNWYDYIGRALSYPLNDRHAFVLNDERVQRLISRFLSNETFNHRSPGDQAKVVKGLIPAPVNEDGDPMGFKVVWE